MDKRIAEWLASGDTGSSSKAIMLWLSAGVKDRHWGSDTPSDPSDLGRCLRLLERIPEWKSRIGEMAEAGGLWPTFSRRWAEMEAMFIEECGGNLLGKGEGHGIVCTRTYSLMKAVEAEAYATDKPGFGAISLGEGISVRAS